MSASIATRRRRGPTVVPLKGEVTAALESAYLFALNLGSAWDSNIPGAVRHRLLEHAAELGAIVVRSANKEKPCRNVRLRHPHMDLDALGTAANSGGAG